MWFVELLMNISQIALYPKIDTFVLEQNKKGEPGMLDLAIPVIASSGLSAVLFKFIGYSRSRVMHSIGAKCGR